MRVAIATIAIVIAPAVAAACQCGTELSPQEAFAASPLVVAGVVVEIKETELQVQYGGGPFTWVIQDATFQVQRVWKGFPGPTLLLSQRSNCAIQLSEGASYLLYLSTPQDGDREVSKCSRFRRYAHADLDLEFLGPGEPVPRKVRAQ